mmetsp:Transcript_67724/g.202399  ORF Transcript_67724/g.202399 Transcript_67724/m.202399 type:complete len:364 (+) Transcript_67724:404-1495(+)
MSSASKVRQSGRRHSAALEQEVFHQKSRSRHPAPPHTHTERPRLFGRPARSNRLPAVRTAVCAVCPCAIASAKAARMGTCHNTQHTNATHKHTSPPRAVPRAPCALASKHARRAKHAACFRIVPHSRRAARAVTATARLEGSWGRQQRSARGVAGGRSAARGAGLRRPRGVAGRPTLAAGCGGTADISGGAWRGRPNSGRGGGRPNSAGRGGGGVAGREEAHRVDDAVAHEGRFGLDDHLRAVGTGDARLQQVGGQHDGGVALAIGAVGDGLDLTKSEEAERPLQRAETCALAADAQLAPRVRELPLAAAEARDDHKLGGPLDEGGLHLRVDVSVRHDHRARAADVRLPRLASEGRARRTDGR